MSVIKRRTGAINLIKQKEKFKFKIEKKSYNGISISQVIYTFQKMKRKMRKELYIFI